MAKSSNDGVQVGKLSAKPDLLFECLPLWQRPFETFS